MARRPLKPPAHVAACPDCGSRVFLYPQRKGTTRARWVCSQVNRCGSSGIVFDSDGYMAVTERYRVLHRVHFVSGLGALLAPGQALQGIRRGKSYGRKDR